MILTPELETLFIQPKYMLGKFEAYMYTDSKLAINQQCNDSTVIYINRLGFLIRDCRFRHDGCVISRISADVMCQLTRDVDAIAWQTLCQEFLRSLETNTISTFGGDHAILNDLSDMTVNRKKCVALPWIGLLNLLKDLK